MSRRAACPALLLMILALTPAAAPAEVKEADASGFTVSHSLRVDASPDRVWASLIQPARWWSPQHSWSGDAKNLSLDARAGGCYCERWSGGEVEHARVLHVVPNRMLRLSGALGPLQGEALTGTLTFQLKAEGAGTRLSVDYVVGGHARMALKDVAPAVDGVIGEQAARLARLFDN